MSPPDRATVVGTALMIAAWLAFVLVMLRRPSPPGGPSTTPRGAERRDRRSFVGIVLQGLAYACVWWPPHWALGRATLRLDGHPWGPWTLARLLAIAALMFGGVALARAALRTLGRQWSLVARVAADGALVTDGPYAHVRHPIYTAMLLLLVGTALAISGMTPLLLALAAFAIGTAIRTRAEEALLREGFGERYAAYAARVPAVLPWRRAP